LNVRESKRKKNMRPIPSERGESEQSQKRKSASYMKPELVDTGPAVSLIQGTNKQSQFLETALIKHATPAAYEADE
jgi:hypothetical protein